MIKFLINPDANKGNTMQIAAQDVVCGCTTPKPCNFAVSIPTDKSITGFSFTNPKGELVEVSNLDIPAPYTELSDIIESNLTLNGFIVEFPKDITVSYDGTTLSIGLLGFLSDFAIVVSGTSSPFVFEKQCTVITLCDYYAVFEYEGAFADIAKGSFAPDLAMVFPSPTEITDFTVEAFETYLLAQNPYTDVDITVVENPGDITNTTITVKVTGDRAIFGEGGVNCRHVYTADSTSGENKSPWGAFLVKCWKAFNTCIDTNDPDDPNCESPSERMAFGDFLLSGC